MVGVAVFSVPALLYVAAVYVPGLPWGRGTAVGKAMMVLSVAGAAWVATYKGFVFAVTRSIPFWNSPLLPPLFVAYGLRGGLAVLLLVGACGGAFSAFHAVEVVKLWTVVSSAALVLVYVWIMSEAGVTARRSALEIVRGRAAAAFYLGVVALGIVVPLAGGALAFFTELSGLAVGAIGVCSLAGDFYVTYTIAKAGIYTPLVLGALPQQ